MRELNAKITITKILIAVVIVIGLVLSYNLAFTGPHLAGDVYTAKELNFTIKPVRLMYDQWGEGKPFTHDGHVFKHGIGMYIPWDTLRVGQESMTKLGLWLGGEYKEAYFDLCADTEWTSGPDSGYYRVVCYSNGEIIFDSGYCTQDDRQRVRLKLQDADDLIIELYEEKGQQGTFNVILGEFEMSKK